MPASMTTKVIGVPDTSVGRVCAVAVLMIDGGHGSDGAFLKRLGRRAVSATYQPIGVGDDGSDDHDSWQLRTGGPCYPTRNMINYRISDMTS